MNTFKFYLFFRYSN